MKFLKIEGKNFGAFERFDMDLSKPVTIIIGRNNSGKSTAGQKAVYFALTGKVGDYKQFQQSERLRRPDAIANVDLITNRRAFIRSLPSRANDTGRIEDIDLAHILCDPLWFVNLPQKDRSKMLARIIDPAAAAAIILPLIQRDTPVNKRMHEKLKGDVFDRGDADAWRDMIILSHRRGLKREVAEASETAKPIPAKYNILDEQDTSEALLAILAKDRETLTIEEKYKVEYAAWNENQGRALDLTKQIADLKAAVTDTSTLEKLQAELQAAFTMQAGYEKSLELTEQFDKDTKQANELQDQLFALCFQYPDGNEIKVIEPRDEYNAQDKKRAGFKTTMSLFDQILADGAHQCPVCQTTGISAETLGQAYESIKQSISEATNSMIDARARTDKWDSLTLTLNGLEYRYRKALNDRDELGEVHDVPTLTETEKARDALKIEAVDNREREIQSKSLMSELGKILTDKMEPPKEGEVERLQTLIGAEEVEHAKHLEYEIDLKVFNDKQDRRAVQEADILECNWLDDQLKPGGVVRAKLVEGGKELPRFPDLAKAWGVENYQVRSNGVILLNGHDVRDTSDSEQWRVAALVGMAISKYLDAGYCLLDVTCQLDDINLRAMIKHLEHVDLESIIVMVADKRSPEELRKFVGKYQYANFYHTTIENGISKIDKL